MLIDSLQQLASCLGKDTPGRTISPRQTVEKVMRMSECVCTDTLSYFLSGKWFHPIFLPERNNTSALQKSEKSKYALCFLLTLNIALWVCVPESRFFECAYIRDSCHTPALAHTDIHIHILLSPFASHSKCKWRWSLETGPAGEEMRLSFKGSAGDALKLPITHLDHASVGLRTHDRQGERKKGTGWKDSKSVSFISKHALLACVMMKTVFCCQITVPAEP